MVFRTRRRTSVGETSPTPKFGFRTKAILNEEGFYEGKFLIVTNEGRQLTEIGRSKNGVPAVDWKTLREDARLNAVSKVLYREGYFVDKSNYENLDLDKIDKAEVIDYNFYYLENQFMTFSRMKRRVKTKKGIETRNYIVDRDSKGRFKKVYRDTARKDSGRLKDLRGTNTERFK